MAAVWTLEVYETKDGTVPFDRFLGGLSGFKLAAVNAAMKQVLAARGIDLAGTEWLKALGNGLHEFRVRHDAEEITHMFGNQDPAGSGKREKILLRIFVHFHGNKIVLLLGGYDKGADPKEKRQQREIARARALLVEFKERQRQQKRRRRDTPRHSR